ncbi:hypothetical protein GCM10027612_27530 [Microbispora bryophytorum subsp. camponoti]
MNAVPDSPDSNDATARTRLARDSAGSSRSIISRADSRGSSVMAGIPSPPDARATGDVRG